MTRTTSKARRARKSRDVLERAWRSVLEHDATGFANLFAADGVLELPFAEDAAGSPSCIEGREEIRRHVSRAMARARREGHVMKYDDVMVHETADEEVMIVEFDPHVEVSGIGRTQPLPCLQVLRIRDGAIVWLRDYFSSERLADAVVRMAPVSDLQGGSVRTR